MRPVRFSHQYRVTRTTADDWFDPLLNEDTRLYVDPFRIFVDEDPFWANGHVQLMTFFNTVMKLLADSGFAESSPFFKKAKALLLFPEPPEFCLGTSKESVFGAGSAKGLQEGMLKGAAEAIELGLEDLKHFEELALFGQSIGADRVSDMTCDVLKGVFVEYTRSIARRHNIPLSPVNLRHCGWDVSRFVWNDAVVELPLNPVMTARVGIPVGVLLTPKRFLRKMPSIDPYDFWDYAWSHESEKIRTDLNYEVATNVDAEKIARLARRKRHLLRAYLDDLEANPKPPYDVDEDPELIVRRSDYGREIAGQFEFGAPATETEFDRFVDRLLDNFKQSVEDRGAWRLLWANGKPRREVHAQLLFHTSAVWVCEDHDVDISPESNAGRGPVDFKVSHGWRLRVLFELKLAKSSSFRKNLRSQTPTYLRSEGVQRGYFIVIQFAEEDFDPELVRSAEELAKKVADREGISYRVVWIDARPKESASNL